MSVGSAAEPPRRTATQPNAWLAWLRLRHWVHFLLLPLAGLDPDAPSELLLPAAARGMTIAFAVLGFGYLLNSLSDRAVDLDPDKGSLPTSGTAPKVLVAALLLLAVSLAWTAPAVVQGATAICLLSGALYSVGPRWKALPLLGSALNLTNFAPLLVVGAMADRPMPLLVALLALFAPLLLQNQLLHEAADAPEDRAAGISTTFVRFGRRWTALLGAACGLCAAWVASEALQTALRWPVTLVCFALFGVYVPLQLWQRGEDAAEMARWRVQHRWLALGCGGLTSVLLWVWWIAR